MSMQVIGKVPCVTRASGVLYSLAPGHTYELPDAVAQKLVDAGLCVPVEEEPKAPTQQPTKTEDPVPPAPVKKAPAKKAPAKKAPAKPRSRKAPTKSVGAAPENKGASGAQD